MKFSELTARQLAETNREKVLVVIPIAAVEQHGPHMPTGTDTILCTAIAEALESDLESRILLTPTVWLGASAHHLRFGATLDSALDSYIDTLCDIGRSLLHDGFKRILFLNGHGGNIDPMRIALRTLQASWPDSLLAAGCYWSGSETDREQILEGDHKFVGHACEFETSLMLHIRPDLVDREHVQDAGELITDQIDGMFLGRDMRHRTRDGYTGRPDLASPEKGAKLFTAIQERLFAAAEKLLIQPLGTKYPDFL